MAQQQSDASEDNDFAVAASNRGSFSAFEWPSAPPVDCPFQASADLPGTTFATPLPYGGRYPCGSLVHNGIWYYGTYCLDETSGRNLSWDVLGPFVGFRISHDLGQTWSACPHTAASSIFGESGKQGGRVKMGTPHVVDFGKTSKLQTSRYEFMAMMDSRSLAKTA